MSVTEEMQIGHSVGLTVPFIMKTIGHFHFVTFLRFYRYSGKDADPFLFIMPSFEEVCSFSLLSL